ncbi:MAG: SUMF1/EgtB/PvdO family nonheme iron enzyme [Candidatus Accumulibacter sp.]|uniref:SUMF1/EgtB/PvdO family nonheme iron enzyme n=1 Tax=Accumulibacter sp. TaxID=2053492 RepID=UPI001AC17AFD|nr:SUMF1/EgtB/PvdO family nonheme iron enzyme [Accumulibacter sp.]MBN8519118.1 SUMF1/EgtB/PvdO family nonheme iron enzyme [Accumulibacter sp.]
MIITRKIFLASSQELEDDRRQFEIFIARENKSWVKQGVELELVLWEDFLDAVSRTRLQDEYNEAVRSCDLFVLLFFTKVGPYTAEEFAAAYEHFQATGKPLLYTYFKDAPHNAARADLLSLWAFQDKLEALRHFPTKYSNVDQLKLHFRQQLDKLAANGFGDSPPDRAAPTAPGGGSFEALLTGDGAIAQGAGAIAVAAGGQFTQIVKKKVQRRDKSADDRAIIADYLAALASELSGLKLGEIDVAASDARREPLQLADVYVPLATHLRLPAQTTLAQWLASDRQRTHGERADLETAAHDSRPVPALEALAQHRQLTLLGAAGSGKSTFGASVLLTLAQAWPGQADRLVDLGDSWTHGALLPVRVVLRRFAEALPAGGTPSCAGDLWAFIGRSLDAAGYGLSPATCQTIRRVARDQGALFLFDGLDECGSEAACRRVLGAVEEFMRSAGRHCRFLLTARPYAWPGGADPAHGVYALADLDDEQIEQFIRAWYAALAKRQWLSPGDAGRKCDDLLAARQRPDLRPLAQNPLLLTLMASLHANRGRLPDDRADLYDDSIHLLLLRWNRQIGADQALLDALAIPTLKLADLRGVLEELAFAVHAGSAVGPVVLHAGPAAAGAPADIGEGRLLAAFRPLLQGSLDKAAIVVDYIEKRAGLLVGQGFRNGERQFAFPHRSFQEFLAACHLAARPDFATECARLARQAPGHWQLVLPLAARLAKAERGASAADELIGGQAIADCRRQRPIVAADWTCALLAGRQLLEIGVGAIRQRERTAAIAARVAGWLAASLPLHPGDGGVTRTLRAQAGDVLAQLGDPRFDAQRFFLPADDGLGFVRVAADPGFMIGTRPGDRERVSRIAGFDVGDDEINDTTTPTPEFYIARHPVTVAQFRAFVEATGLAIGDSRALRDPDSRPVRYVSWHEALAWCDWLTEVLATSGVFAGHPIASLVREHAWRVALPSELEWEKAARGGLAGAVFPWGDEADPERANYDAAEINDSSAVGCFPANGFGLYDLAGNVWEWTRSLWGDDWEKPTFAHPYEANDPRREALDAVDGILRVVRGGSWYGRRDLARCAYRSGVHPGDRDVSLGFRVVLRSSPVP